MKDTRHRTPTTGERDRVAETTELRDSVSGSLERPKEVGRREKISSDFTSREEGSVPFDTLMGSVYMSGNEPFTRLTLSLEDGRRSMFIQADTSQVKQLRTLQGRVVQIVGLIVKSGSGDYIDVKKFVIVR